MTGLIFAKTMSPTTRATVIAVWSRSAVVPAMSASLRFAGADEAVRLDGGRLDRAPGAHLPASPRSDATRRLPRGEGPERRVTLGHGDLRGSWRVREKDSRPETMKADC